MKRPTSLSLMDCSTGHLSRATRRLLEKAYGRLLQDIAVRDAGFFLSSLAEERGTLPLDLSLVKRFARENGFDYILFDADADPSDILPWYEDANIPAHEALDGFGISGRLTCQDVDGDEICAVDHWPLPEGAFVLPPDLFQEDAPSLSMG